MAIPTFGITGSNLSSASGTSAVVSAPASVVSTSIVVVGIFLDGSAQAVTPPAGGVWAELEASPIDVSPTSHGLHVFAARGPAGSTYTFTWSSSTYRSGFAARYDNGVTSGSPFDAGCNSAQSNTNSTSSPAVSVTSLDVDRLDILFATNWSGGTWTAPATPAGFVKRQQGGDDVIALFDRPHATAGSTGSVSATCTGSDKTTAWMGALIGTTGGAAATSLIIPRRPRIGALLDL